MLNHNSLSNYYELTFALVQHHKYSFTEIENMIPWELAIYVALIERHLKNLEAAQHKAETENES